MLFGNHGHGEDGEIDFIFGIELTDTESDCSELRYSQILMNQRRALQTCTH